jgi:hypothetical protein
MDDISTLSIGPGPQALVNPGPYLGGGTAPPEPDFLPDSTAMEQGTNVTNTSTAGVPTRHSMSTGNSGVDGGAGGKRPSKMRPGNTLTPR